MHGRAGGVSRRPAHFAEEDPLRALQGACAIPHHILSSTSRKTSTCRSLARAGAEGSDQGLMPSTSSPSSPRTHGRAIPRRRSGMTSPAYPSKTTPLIRRYGLYASRTKGRWAEMP
jgi:hypothetical protein